MKLTWWKVAGGIVVAATFGAAPLVDAPDGYYIRTASADKAQFSKVERTHDLKGLTEAHIIGSACYDQFTAPLDTVEPIRKRIDCAEYWNRANIPDYPTPTRSEEHTSELQSQSNIVCRLLL